LLDGQPIGWIGEIHPLWQQRYDLPQAAVWFEVEVSALLAGAAPRASDVSKFQPARRDLAVVVDEAVTAATLVAAMQQAAPAFVAEVALFDVYRGKGLESGKKSLAFRVLLQDTQKTLTEAEIESSMAQLVAALQSTGAQLRS
jgi:phenylalanyl-tRNA synthetase beta chain